MLNKNVVVIVFYIIKEKKMRKKRDVWVPTTHAWTPPLNQLLDSSVWTELKVSWNPYIIIQLTQVSA